MFPCNTIADQGPIIMILSILHFPNLNKNTSHQCPPPVGWTNGTYVYLQDIHPLGVLLATFSWAFEEYIPFLGFFPCNLTKANQYPASLGSSLLILPPPNVPCGVGEGMLNVCKLFPLNYIDKGFFCWTLGLKNNGWRTTVQMKVEYKVFMQSSSSNVI